MSLPEAETRDDVLEYVDESFDKFIVVGLTDDDTELPATYLAWLGDEMLSPEELGLLYLNLRIVQRMIEEDTVTVDRRGGI